MKSFFFCETCQLGKHHCSSFKRSDSRAEKVRDLVHTDVCGAMQERSIGGSRHFVLFKDDFSEYRTVYLIKQKSEVPECIEKYLAYSLCHQIRQWSPIHQPKCHKAAR